MVLTVLHMFFLNDFATPNVLALIVSGCTAWLWAVLLALSFSFSRSAGYLHAKKKKNGTNTPS